MLYLPHVEFQLAVYVTCYIDPTFIQTVNYLGSITCQSICVGFIVDNVT